jgi:hypothetical protein
MELAAAQPRERQYDYYPWLLGLVVLISRALTTGPVYFANGPFHVAVIEDRIFVLEPPGYWLFNRIAGLFSDPVAAIVGMNWTFSVAGVVTFYYAARLLVRPAIAKWGAAIYGGIFYAWFSGNVHSPYASQLFFPVLLFLFLLLHQRRPQTLYLVGAAIAFAAGAGFRPSDGAFLSVMYLYYLFRYARRRQALLSFGLATCLCLGWVVPTLLFYQHEGGMKGPAEWTLDVCLIDSLLANGITFRTAANVVRFFLPLAVAFWPLLLPAVNTLRDFRDLRVRLLWLWLLPGAGFLILVLMQHAPYMNFLTAALLLLALMRLEGTLGKWSHWALAACLVSNIGFYLFFKPIQTHRLSVNTFNAYAGRYTRYAVKHRWDPQLSDLHDKTNPLGAHSPVKGSTE